MNSKKNQLFSFVILSVLVLLSRLPFLNNGYGIEEDSWGLAINAQEIADTGHYIFSRLPGHPVQELFLAIFSGAGAFVFNLFSALFSVVAVIYFSLILKHYKINNYFLASLAFALTPVIYINSTCTIDYCWALAFILISIFYFLKKKYIISGIILGIATGCRITSILAFIPFLIIIWDEIGGTKKWKTIFLLSFSLSITALITYIPALYEYGSDIINTYSLPYPPIAKSIYKASIGVWGIPGLIAITIIVISIIINRKNKYKQTILEIPKSHITAWISIILIYTLAYIRLPEKSAFFIPAIPFIYILTFRFLKSIKVYTIFCLLMIISPFFFSVNISDTYRGSDYSKIALKASISGQEIFFDPVNGPIFSDYTKRINKERFTKQVIKKLYSLNKPSVIITGWWYNQITATLLGKPYPANAILIDYSDEKHLKKAKDYGFKIYYFPEINDINDKRYNNNFTSTIARPFPF